MYKSAIDIVMPFKDLRSSMTLIITAWDESDGSDTLKIETSEFFKQKLKIDSLIFTGHNVSSDELLHSMRAQLRGTPVTVKISPETIGRYFDLTSNDLDIIDEIDRIKTEFSNYTMSVREQAMDLPDGQEKEDFVFSAQNALRETLEALLDEFRKKYFPDTEIGYEEYASLEQLHDQLEATYKIYRSYCRQFIRTFYADVDSGPDHPTKRCPHCGLVWLKVEG